MNSFDRAQQPEKIFSAVLREVLLRNLLPVLCVMFFIVYAFVEPEHRYLSLFLVIIGMSGLARDIKRHTKAREL